MPAPRLHETVIADRIIELIDQALSMPLNLKVVTMGALDLYPALENLAANVPAIFVKPSPSTNLERITTGQTYRITYNFRLVFVRAFGPNEEAVRSKTVDTQQIEELLMDNVNLGHLSLPNAQVLSATLRTVEWDPPEEALAASINADLVASALVFTVDTTSRI